MNCPSCGHMNCKVVDSRASTTSNSIRRRRECEVCKYRFTTFERLQSSNFLIEKRNKSTEPYDRQKLEGGILAACAKRPISLEKIRENLNELEEKWGRNSVVSSKQVGSDVVQMLREIDEVAFIRFASVYQEFDGIESFRVALAEIEES